MDSPAGGYTSPPVVETAIAFEFQPRPEIGIRELVHVGDHLPGGFNRFEQHPPLPPRAVDLPPENDSGWQILPRLWAIDDTRQLLVQLQVDRVVLNWRKTSEPAPYPGHQELLTEFEGIWSGVQGGYTEAGVPLPTPSVAEFTYVNQIQDEDGFNWTHLFSPVYRPELEGVVGAMHFQMERALIDPEVEQPLGMITVEAHKTALSEPSVLIVSTRIYTTTDPDPLARLADAHSTSLRMFQALTTDEAQDRWRRADD